MVTYGGSVSSEQEKKTKDFEVSTSFLGRFLLTLLTQLLQNTVTQVCP